MSLGRVLLSLFIFFVMVDYAIPMLIHRPIRILHLGVLVDRDDMHIAQVRMDRVDDAKLDNP